MRKLILSTLAVGMLLAAATSSPAQTDLKPVITVSFSGYDKLLVNANVIGQLGGNPNMGQGLEMMVALMTQGKGLAGLDTKRPWGAAVLTNGQPPFAVYGFVPVTDLKQLMGLAEGTQLSESIKLVDDVYQIQTGAGPTVYVKQIGKWAVATQKNENLANAPADPLKLLGDLPQSYDLAIRLSAKNTPKEFRDQAMAQLRAAAEVGLPQMPDESDESYALRAAATRHAAETLAALAEDLDDLLLGWQLDPATKTFHLDLEITAQTGTKLADRLGLMKPGKTNFAGLMIPNAAVAANWTRTLADDDVAQAKKSLAMVREMLSNELQKRGLAEAEQKLALQLLGDAIGVVEKTLETKKSDGGLAVLLDPGAQAGAGHGDLRRRHLDRRLRQTGECPQAIG